MIKIEKFKMMRYKIEPLYCEKQSLMQCAIHAVNNLLQLKSCKIKGEHTHHTPSDELLYDGILYHHGEMKCATKEEFDCKADELTLKEHALLVEGYSDIDRDKSSVGIKSERKKLSLWNRLNSHNRTPLTGNYSIEVLQEALSNRNVDLKWFKPSSQQGKINQEKDDVHSNNGNDKVLIIGYIINQIQPFSIINPLRAFYTSRHWLAVTKVRRIVHEETKNYDKSGSTKSKHETILYDNYDKDSWHRIDSQMDNIVDLGSDAELLDFLQQIEKDGGNIFQATLRALKY